MSTFKVLAIVPTPLGDGVHLKAEDAEVIITPTPRAFNFNVKSRGNVHSKGLQFLVDDWYVVEKKMNVKVGDEIEYPTQRLGTNVFQLADTQENFERLQKVAAKLRKLKIGKRLEVKVVNPPFLYHINITWEKEKDPNQNTEIEYALQRKTHQFFRLLK